MECALAGAPVGPRPVPESAVRKGLRLRTPVTALRLVRAPSGRAASAEAVTPLGTTKLTGTALRAATGLRSTWITKLVSLSVTRPGGAALFGRPVTLTGNAVGVKGAVLEQRVAASGSGLERPVRGRLRSSLAAPGVVRITAGTLVGPTLRIPLAPHVAAKAVGALTLSGSSAARPRLGGRAPGRAGRRHLGHRRRGDDRRGRLLHGLASRARHLCPRRAGRAACRASRPDRGAMKRLVLAAAAAALFAPSADAARYAVGARSSADLPALLQALPGAESPRLCRPSSSSGRVRPASPTSPARRTSRISARDAWPTCRTIPSCRSSGT